MMTSAPAALPVADGTEPEPLLLRLDGFEGPLHLLLDLARAEKVDLTRISILALVEQFLAVIEGARRVRLELAADWLVMAAWLAWLKSRLLLPAKSPGAEEGEEAAEALAARLRALQAMRRAAAWLGARPMLGQDVFARGAPEDFTETDRSRLLLDLPALLRAYVGAARRGMALGRYRPPPPALWSVQDALGRLSALLGTVPDWSELERFLPDRVSGSLERRAALASTLVASMEMARGGRILLRQEAAFGPILLRANPNPEPDAALEPATEPGDAV